MPTTSHCWLTRPTGAPSNRAASHQTANGKMFIKNLNVEIDFLKNLNVEIAFLKNLNVEIVVYFFSEKL